MVEPAAADPAAWATPGAPADDRTLPVPPLPAPPPVAGPAGPPPVPVPLRAMSMTDRLDGAFRVLKLAPGTVLALAALVVVPVQLLDAALAREDGGREGWEAVLGPGPLTLLVDDRVDWGSSLVLLALQSAGLAFASAGIAILVSGWYVGRRATTATVLAAAARLLPVLVGSWVLVHLAELLFGLLLVVGALVPMVWFAVVAPVVGVEGVGPIEALRRSYDLTRRSFGPVLGTVLAVGAVDVLLRLLLGIVVVAGGFDGSGGGAVVAAAIGIAIQLLTTSFVAGVAALLYVDLRVRVEGIDIELAAVERFPGG